MSCGLAFRGATCMAAMASGPWSMRTSGVGRSKASGMPCCKRRSTLSLPTIENTRPTTPPPVTKDSTVRRQLPQTRLRPPKCEASCQRDLAYIDHREFVTPRSGKAHVIRNSDLTAPFLKYRADNLHVCIARWKGWQTGPKRMLWDKDDRERPPRTASQSSADSLLNRMR